MTASHMEMVALELRAEGIGFTERVEGSLRRISWRQRGQAYELYFTQEGALERARIRSQKGEVGAFKVPYEDSKGSYHWLFMQGSCCRFYSLARWLGIDELFGEIYARSGS